MSLVVEGSELFALYYLFDRRGEGVVVKAEELVESGPRFSVVPFRIIAIHGVPGDDLMCRSFEPFGQLQQLFTSVQGIAGHSCVEG